MAAVLAIEKARHLNWTKLWLETDCALLVKAFSDSSLVPLFKDWRKNDENEIPIIDVDSYVYEIDMPRLKFGSERKAGVEDDDFLVISEEKKREEGVEYSRMERRVGKFKRKFVLPKNANAVSAICQDGVLSVTVQKLPPPPPPQPKNTRRTIPVIIA
ncbi:17.9 kDa class II heat shock protein-like [Vicia villosa]|uniref:17.9 kDa class II heat shock protein-like n=1 Tax=Vicia villosa TaxID=3911 RepID=UPI00273AA2E8|nr:17.9 kDa class II heat shock protein-like [Vicia villosa]